MSFMIKDVRLKNSVGNCEHQLRVFLKNVRLALREEVKQ